MVVILLSFLAFSDTSQLVWVKPTSHFQTEIQRFEKIKGHWKKMDSWPAVIGKKGFAEKDHKTEGDLKTPTGLYNLTDVWGVEDKIQTHAKYTRITAEDKWIDDPASPDYNKWVRGPTLAKSYETMLRNDHQYDLLVVIDYNMAPVVQKKGSAIFAHIWKSPDLGTAGCIAMEKSHIKKLVAWLDPSKEPKILLGKSNRSIEGWRHEDFDSRLGYPRR
jgi:L,D-peptidoglycan transpeptidase YkuD (ErfK/YbiS/YcfS/YnhG family)